MMIAVALGLFFLATPAFAQFTPAQNAYLHKNELLKNPDAENGVVNWVSTIKMITSGDYFSGTQAFEVTANNQIISVCQSADTTKKLQNGYLGGSCKVKTDSDKMQICNVVNGVKQDCSPIEATGEYETASPDSGFTAGTSTSGICIESTVPVTTTVRFDNCSLAETSDSTTVISPELGGTGLTDSGAVGNFLMSDGSGGWISAPLVDNLASLNGINSSQQFFGIGVAGNDFNISSVSDTHTFNLPYASATKSGRLTSTDWSIFSSKIDGLSFSIPDEIVLFGGSDGKTTKRSTGTGLAVLTNGVLSTIPVATAGYVIKSDGTNWISAPETGGGGGGSGTNDPYNSSQLALNNGSTITLSNTDTNQIILVQGNSGPITLNSLPLSGTVADGTQIRIIGNHSDNTVELTSNDIAKGLILNGNAVLGKYNVITLIFNQALNRYIETSRNF